MLKSYHITGMHCGSCVRKITLELNKLVESVEVTLDPPRAVLQNDILPDLAILNLALIDVGKYVLTEEIIDQIPSGEEHKSWLSTYYPLLLIIGLISIASIAGATSWHEWMLHFMAGFFIVFSFFKLLDLQGFCDAYATYDLLAKHWRIYGFIYPFLELVLGLFFLFQFELRVALYASIVLMGFSSLGVIQALLEKRKIQCACLGTVLNLPMSTITLVEDLGMVIMSIMMLAVL